MWANFIEQKINMLKYTQSMPKSGKVKNIIFLLHGYGSNDADLQSIAPELEQHAKDTLIITPQAPFNHEGGVPGGFQWYSLAQLSNDIFVEEAKKIYPLVEELIEYKMKEYDLSYKDVVLAGFSQGAMITQYVGFRLPGKLKGVIMLSGYMADHDTLQSEIKHKPPTLILHGKMDLVVPDRALDDARETLSDLGVKVETHKLEGLGHGINFEAIEKIEGFLKKIML